MEFRSYCCGPGVKRGTFSPIVDRKSVETEK